MADLQAYCKSLVRNAQTNFYYAFLFLPRPKREAIFAAYAFSRHTDDLVDDAESPDRAVSDLQAWRTELDACYEGNPSHPITQNLRKMLDQFPIPKEPFVALIDGVRMDLEINRYESFEDLREFCYGVASAVGLICIEIFGYRSPSTRDYAVDLGIALQLTNILRDVKADALQDRIYLPLEDLRSFGYSVEELLENRHTQAFEKLMAYQVERARSYYAKAREILAEEDQTAMFSAEIMAGIYYRILEGIEESGYRVFDREFRIGNLRKLWLALSLWLRSRWMLRGPS